MRGFGLNVEITFIIITANTFIDSSFPLYSLQATEVAPQTKAQDTLTASTCAWQLPRWTDVARTDVVSTQPYLCTLVEPDVRKVEEYTDWHKRLQLELSVSQDLC